MSKPTKPVTVELSERELDRIDTTITNFEFRYQVEAPDAAQRAADDLAIMLPILQKLVTARKDTP